MPRHRLSRYKLGGVGRRAIPSLDDPQSCASKPCGLFCHLGRQVCEELHDHATLSGKLRSIARTGHQNSLGTLALQRGLSSRRSPRVPGAVVSALRSRHAAGDAWPTKLPATKYCQYCAMRSTARVLGCAECARWRHRHFAMVSGRTASRFRRAFAQIRSMQQAEQHRCSMQQTEEHRCHLDGQCHAAARLLFRQND